MQDLGIPVVQGHLLAKASLRTTAATRDALLMTLRELRLGVAAAADEVMLRPAGSMVQPVERTTHRTSAALLLGNRDLPAVAVVDARGRPQELLLSHAGRVEVLKPMTCRAQEAPVLVLQRALARPLPERLDPLLMVGHDGCLVGLLEVDTLLGSVHRALGASQAGGRGSVEEPMS